MLVYEIIFTYAADPFHPSDMHAHTHTIRNTITITSFLLGCKLFCVDFHLSFIYEMKRDSHCTLYFNHALAGTSLKSCGALVFHWWKSNRFIWLDTILKSNLLLSYVGRKEWKYRIAHNESHCCFGSKITLRLRWKFNEIEKCRKCWGKIAFLLNV